MADADEIRRQQVLQRRFERMGLEVGVLAGGRSLLVTLPVGPEPFATPQGARRLQAVRFYTVGHDRIKCFAPRALFFLPLVRSGDCETAAQLEARIRSAWRERLRSLDRTRQWLADLGVRAERPAGAPQWRFPLGLEDPRACASAVEPGRVLLPGRGPLSGMVLEHAEQRVLAIEPVCSSAADLEIAVTARLEALARSRRRVVARRPSGADAPIPRTTRQVPVLVVGGRIASNRPLLDALRLRGLAVRGARSLADALDAFQGRTFEAVLAEARLDRADGLELIHAVRTLPGILELPVAVVDDRPRSPRADAARRAGAAAYWSGPLDVERTADAFAQLAQSERRRFHRYVRALSVSWEDGHRPGVTATIGRGGMFLRTSTLPAARRRYALHLAETGTTLRVQADPVYRLPDAGVGPEGVGLRFCAFEGAGERAWIDFLAGLEARTSAPAAIG